MHADAYRTICDAICEAVASGCDLCFLDLHGAMVAESAEDGEGALLERIRSIAPELPIAVSLDLHANLTEKIVSNCTALVGYKTYPHVDMYEAGAHAGRIVVRALAGEVRPVMAWGNRPILAQTLRMGHEDEPMGPLIEAAREAERGGLLAASVFGGFPLADFWHAGFSVVTVADGDRARAEAVCEGLLDAAWVERREFVFDSRPLEETIAHAGTLSEGPVILLDHADNSASGGTHRHPLFMPGHDRLMGADRRTGFGLPAVLAQALSGSRVLERSHRPAWRRPRGPSAPCRYRRGK